MKILLFKNLEICNNSLNAFMGYIAEELSVRDIEYEYIDITGSGECIPESLYEVMDNRIDAVLAFNDPNIHSAKLPDGESIYDKYNVQFFNWIVDHPISQLHYLESDSRNYNIICVDRKQAEFVKRYNPGIRSVSFLPLGGILPKEEELLSLREREYDIVFPGGVMAGTLQEALDSYNSMESPNKDIILNVIDYMMESCDDDATTALDIVLKDRFGIAELREDDYRKALQLANAANNFMRSYNRERVLRCLINTDLNLHIYGSGWKERIGTGSGYTVFNKNVPYGETGILFEKAKILLNVMPCFKDGTHDRIAGAMLGNALAITDHSRYIDEWPQGIMSFYDINNVDVLPDILRDLLNDIDNTQIMADRGHSYALEHFTWGKTVDALLEIMGS